MVVLRGPVEPVHDSAGTAEGAVHESILHNAVQGAHIPRTRWVRKQGLRRFGVHALRLMRLAERASCGCRVSSTASQPIACSVTGFGAATSNRPGTPGGARTRDPCGQRMALRRGTANAGDHAPCCVAGPAEPLSRLALDLGCVDCAEDRPAYPLGTLHRAIVDHAPSHPGRPSGRHLGQSLRCASTMGLNLRPGKGSVKTWSRLGKERRIDSVRHHDDRLKGATCSSLRPGAASDRG